MSSELLVPFQNRKSEATLAEYIDSKPLIKYCWEEYLSKRLKNGDYVSNRFLYQAMTLGNKLLTTSPQFINHFQQAQAVFCIPAQGAQEGINLRNTIEQIVQSDQQIPYAILAFVNQPEGSEDITSKYAEELIRQLGLDNVALIKHSWASTEKPFVVISRVRGMISDVAGYLGYRLERDEDMALISFDADLERKLGDLPGIPSDYLTEVTEELQGAIIGVGAQASSIYGTNLGTIIRMLELGHNYAKSLKLKPEIQNDLFVGLDEFSFNYSEQASAVRLSHYLEAGGYTGVSDTYIDQPQVSEGLRLLTNINRSALINGQGETKLLECDRLTFSNRRILAQQPVLITIKDIFDNTTPPESNNPWQNWGQLGDRDRMKTVLSQEIDQQEFIDRLKVIIKESLIIRTMYQFERKKNRKKETPNENNEETVERRLPKYSQILFYIFNNLFIEIVESIEESLQHTHISFDMLMLYEFTQRYKINMYISLFKAFAATLELMLIDGDDTSIATIRIAEIYRAKNYQASEELLLATLNGIKYDYEVYDINEDQAQVRPITGIKYLLDMFFDWLETQEMRTNVQLLDSSMVMFEDN